jgi:hypothetical protein
MALKIKVIRGPKSTAHCGGAELVVEWQLGPNDIGYVVQHVVFDYGDTTCEGDPITKPRKVEYWEAWEVVYGVVYMGMNKAGANAATPGVGTDFFILADRGPETEGINTITGRVKFLSLFRLPPSWVNGPQPRAGGLPNSGTAPPGWTDVGALTHTLVSKWNCCGDDCEEPCVTGEPTGTSLDTRTMTKKISLPQHPVARAIAEIPAWAPVAAAPLATIQRGLNALKKFSLSDVRSGIVEYINHSVAREHYGIEEMSRLFLLNRFLLAVPSAPAPRGTPVFGGWVTPSTTEGSGLMWPFSGAPKGGIKLTGKFLDYFGPPHEALREFDYFINFGPRFKSRSRK